MGMTPILILINPPPYLFPDVLDVGLLPFSILGYVAFKRCPVEVCSWRRCLHTDRGVLLYVKVSLGVRRPVRIPMVTYCSTVCTRGLVSDITPTQTGSGGEESRRINSLKWVELRPYTVAVDDRVSYSLREHLLTSAAEKAGLAPIANSQNDY